MRQSLSMKARLRSPEIASWKQNALLLGAFIPDCLRCWCESGFSSVGWLGFILSAWLKAFPNPDRRVPSPAVLRLCPDSAVCSEHKNGKAGEAESSWGSEHRWTHRCFEDTAGAKEYFQLQRSTGWSSKGEPPPCQTERSAPL